MSLKERLAAANAVISYFEDESEWRADQLLTTAGAGATPGGWADLPVEERRAFLERTIAEGDANLLTRLQDAIPPDDILQEWRSIAAGLASLRAFELALLLDDAGVSDTQHPRKAFLRNWDRHPLADRCQWLEDLLLVQDPDTCERLRAEAGLRVDAGLAPYSAEPIEAESAHASRGVEVSEAPVEGTLDPTAIETPATQSAPDAIRTSETDLPSETYAATRPSASPTDATSAEAASEMSSLGPVVPAVDVLGPIFVVHGHDQGILYEAVRVLEHVTSREVIVLHEQANSGRTILEKFEDHAAGAAYAVVLLTADDVGGVASGDRQLPRGRQNVIFELGFFFGKLGRDRVAVLLDHDVEKPSDIDGLVYVGRDQAGAWRHALAKELDAVGIDVDYSKVP